MELMIDTWNVLHQTGILPAETAGIETRGLIKLIQESRWGGERITLICDGTPSESTAGGSRVQTIFTGPHRTADDEIMDRVANSSSARSILVVTSDREIIRSIRSNGAQHISSAAFLQTLVDDYAIPKKTRVDRPSGLSPQLAQEWREHFGINEEVLEELHNTPIPDLRLEPNPQDELQTPARNQKKKRAITPDEPVLPATLLEEARKLLGDESNSRQSPQ